MKFFFIIYLIIYVAKFVKILFCYLLLNFISHYIIL